MCCIKCPEGITQCFCVALSDVTVHMDKWKNETVLQSSFTSQLLNLGQITKERIPQGTREIKPKHLKSKSVHLAAILGILISQSIGLLHICNLE